MRKSLSVRYRCSCCGNYTLREEVDDICQVCAWQEDNAPRDDPDYVGGPNRVSLKQARLNYSVYKVSDIRFLDRARGPLAAELPENNGCGGE